LAFNWFCFGWIFTILEWATDFRENHLWLIALLPIGGFLIGLLYFYFGKDAEAGNNLLIDTIHEPKQVIPFRMAPFVYWYNCYPFFWWFGRT
jgi:H+/Cl- antiporter ClcA